MIKKILAMVTALCMTAAMIPLSAGAAAGDPVLESISLRGGKAVQASSLKEVDATSSYTDLASTSLSNEKIALSWTEAKATYARDYGKYTSVNMSNGEVSYYLADNWATEKAGFTGRDIATLESSLANYKLDNVDAVDLKGEDPVFIIYIKATSESASKKNLFYLAKLEIADGDVATLDTGSSIKGAAVTGVGTTEGKAILNTLKTDADGKAIEYDTATATNDESKSVIKLKSPFQKLEVKAFAEDALDMEDSSQQDVATVYTSGGTVLGTEEELTAALPLTKDGAEDEYVWVVAKVTSEDDSKTEYHVFLVKVTAIPESDASIVSAKVKNDAVSTPDEADFVIEGRQLTASLPYTDGASAKEDLTKLEVALTVSKKAAKVEYGTGHRSGAPNYKKGSQTPDENGVVTIKGLDLAGDEALFIKVTAEDGTTKEYMATVSVSGASNNCAIESLELKGDTDAKKAVITGELSGKGTVANPVEIEAELPWPGSDDWNAYNNNTSAAASQTTLELKAEKHAKVTYKIDESKTTYETVEKLKTAAGGGIFSPDGDKIKKDNILDKAAVSSLGAAKATDVVYITLLVEAEDGTTNVYRIRVSIGKADEEARLLEAVPLNAERPFTEGSYVTEIGEASDDPENPSKVTITVPAGTDLSVLKAKLTVSKLAKVKVETTKESLESSSPTEVGEITTDVLTAGKPVYVKVASQAMKTSAPVNVAYYELTIVVSELADADESDGTKLDLKNGKIIVTTGKEITAEELLGDITYSGGKLQILKNGQDVTADKKVGTGYVVKAGTTELKVVVKGDTNGDAFINPGDATAVMNDYLGEVPFTDSLYKEAAEVNGDNTVNPGDATAIMNLYLGE